jgi:hypothetical protein
MSVSRFDERRELVIREASAIEAAYQRLDILPLPQREQARALMRRYIVSRLDFGAQSDPAAVLAAAVAAKNLHAETWSRVVGFAVDEPTATSALLLEGLNTVADRANDREAEFLARVPGTVEIVLVVSCLVACAWVGLAHGLGRKRSRETWPVLAALLAAIIVLILDLDEPRSGLIRVSQVPMELLQERLAHEQR